MWGVSVIQGPVLLGANAYPMVGVCFCRGEVSPPNGLGDPTPTHLTGVETVFLRTCFKKQGMIPRCCGFVNPQRATAQGRGWVSQPIGLGNQAPTIDLTRFAEYGDNMPLNSGRPSGLRKKPSFEEKTRFQGK